MKIAFDPEDLKKSYATDIDHMASRELKERATLVDIQNEAVPSHNESDSDEFADSRFNEIGLRHGATIAVIKRKDFKQKAITTPMLLASDPKNRFNKPEQRFDLPERQVKPNLLKSISHLGVGFKDE